MVAEFEEIEHSEAGVPLEEDDEVEEVRWCHHSLNEETHGNLCFLYRTLRLRSYVGYNVGYKAGYNVGSSVALLCWF